MTRHIVARTSEIPAGGHKVFGLEGRDIVVCHVNGEFFALLNRCPHEGAPLEGGVRRAPDLAGAGIYQRDRVGRCCCPWHGWELTRAASPGSAEAVRSAPIGRGRKRRRVAEGPYVAETFPVHIGQLRDRRGLAASINCDYCNNEVPNKIIIITVAMRHLEVAGGMIRPTSGTAP